MSQTKKITVDQERKALIDALNNAGLDYVIKEDTIRINAIPKRQLPIYYPITMTEFQHKDVIIRIEQLFSYVNLIIKTPDKEYRVPLDRQGYTLKFYTNTYLEIIFRDLDRPPMPEFQKREMEDVVKFLNECGINFDVSDYRIWIEGTPMYMDSYEIIIRQGDNDIEFRRYISDAVLECRKGNTLSHLFYLKTVKAQYAYPYLVLIFHRFY
jgi:hypothetical protein